MNIGKYEAEKFEMATLSRSSAATGGIVVAHNVMAKIPQIRLTTFVLNGTASFCLIKISNFVRRDKSRQYD